MESYIAFKLLKRMNMSKSKEVGKSKEDISLPSTKNFYVHLCLFQITF